MPTCVAYNCTSRTNTFAQPPMTRKEWDLNYSHLLPFQMKKNSPYVSFFSFPENPDLRNRWVYNCRRQNWKPTKWSKLCSKHFSKDLILRDGFKCSLEVGAVPTIFDFSDTTTINSRQKELKQYSPFERIQLEEKMGEIRRQASHYMKEHSYSLPNSLDLVGVQNKKAKLDIMTLVEENERLSESVQTLAKSERRFKLKTQHLQRRVEKLKDKYDTLKEHSLTSDEKAITSLTSGIPRILLKRAILNKKGIISRKKYPEELKNFALTLQFYSSKGYKYVRKTFGRALPHPSVIRSWHASPNITGEESKALKPRVEKKKVEEGNKNCNLTTDDLSIERLLELDDSKCQLDIGTDD